MKEYTLQVGGQDLTFLFSEQEAVRRGAIEVAPRRPDAAQKAPLPKRDKARRPAPRGRRIVQTKALS